jgi:hypothetical protein
MEFQRVAELRLEIEMEAEPTAKALLFDDDADRRLIDGQERFVAVALDANHRAEFVRGNDDFL